MIYVVATKCLRGAPLLMHIELLWRSRSRSRSFKNRRVEVGSLKIEKPESEPELLCTDSTALVITTGNNTDTNTYTSITGPIRGRPAPCILLVTYMFAVRPYRRPIHCRCAVIVKSQNTGVTLDGQRGLVACSIWDEFFRYNKDRVLAERGMRGGQRQSATPCASVCAGEDRECTVQ
jgi:hypothetical protein